MATFLELQTGDGLILVDVTPGGAAQAAGAADAVVKKAQSTLAEAMKTAKAMAVSFNDNVLDAMVDSGLEEAELELGFQFTGKGNVYLVQSEAQASMKVKFIFRLSPGGTKRTEAAPT